ncbi:hypothetical protein EJB05_18113 [Eragrostis curvula]|uniref:Uncharacterized protein n=1 Tax=Eragrostis curvula TaxID=38414 RepID=A0A5J9VIL0_9POAL|nr:hypothetical protein EJB05_18113 [Eragrostis curvula]
MDVNFSCTSAENFCFACFRVKSFEETCYATNALIEEKIGQQLVIANLYLQQLFNPVIYGLYKKWFKVMKIVNMSTFLKKRELGNMSRPILCPIIPSRDLCGPYPLENIRERKGDFIGNQGADAIAGQRFCSDTFSMHVPRCPWSRGGSWPLSPVLVCRKLF